MNEFKTYHPIVNFIYFLVVIGLSCFLLHPVCLITSFVCAFLYLVVLGGKRVVKTNILFLLPVVLISAIVNPLFNHKGATILWYFPNGNPLTMESIIYGFVAALLILTVISWFYCYSEVMTSDKFIYIFGRIIPSLSLVLSMTLRFVPAFVKQFKEVKNAQKCIGRDIKGGKILIRLKNALSVMSVMITWALENAVDTADSMKARGYGLRGRTAFSVFKFDKRDFIALLCVILFSVYVLFGVLSGVFEYSYFPYVQNIVLTPYTISFYIVYFAMCILPVIVEIKEAIRWNVLKSKI